MTTQERSTSKLYAGFAMAMGLSFHFFGYECARAASISLLAAKVLPLYDNRYHATSIHMCSFILKNIRRLPSAVKPCRMYKWWAPEGVL